MTMEWKSLDPYSSPFFQCYRDTAKRLKWKAGIASTVLSTQMAIDPDNPVKRVMSVGVTHGREQSFLFQNWVVEIGNGSRNRLISLLLMDIAGACMMLHPVGRTGYAKRMNGINVFRLITVG